VSIYDNAAIDIESVAQHHVCGFATYSAKLPQGFHRARNLAAMPFNQGLASGFDAFGFIAKKTGGLDGLFQFRRRSLRVGLGGRVPFEQVRSDEIHALVGALGRKNRGNQQFERVRVI